MGFLESDKAIKNELIQQDVYQNRICFDAKKLPSLPCKFNCKLKFR